MPILNIKIDQAGQSGVFPAIIYILTNDTLAEITTTGYLNGIVRGNTPLSDADMALVTTKTSKNAHTTQVSWFSVVNSGENWSLVQLAHPNLFPITPYVVGPSQSAGYQTIQSAIDAAVAVGGISAAIFVQPGQYTENLDFSGCTVFTVGLTIFGATGLGDQGQVQIVGTHTPPLTGVLVIRNFNLSSDQYIFNSNEAGSSHITLIDMLIDVTNGYTMNLPNWTGILEFFDTTNGVTDNDGGVFNTAGASVFVFDGRLGVGTSNPMTISGLMVSSGGNIGCPVNFITGSTFQIDYATFDNPITFSNNSTGNISNSRISGGSSAAITFSTSGNVSLYSVIPDSSNNPAIAGNGEGILTIGDLLLTSNKSISNTIGSVVNIPLYIVKSNGIESANAVTANGQSGLITTSSLSTAGGGNYSITWTNSYISSTSQVMLTLSGGTNTTKNITLQLVPSSGTATLTIYNNTAVTSLNGTLLISYSIT